jgi:hypothetical protein
MKPSPGAIVPCHGLARRGNSIAVGAGVAGASHSTPGMETGIGPKAFVPATVTVQEVAPPGAPFDTVTV